MVRLSWCAAAFSRAAAVSVAAAFAAGSAKVQKRRTLFILTLRTLRQKSEKKKVCNSDTQCLWNVLSHHLVMSGAGMCQTETRSSVYFFFTHRLYNSWIGQFCCLWVWWIWICSMGQSWMSSNSAASFPLACWLLSPLASPEICRQMNVKHEGKALWLLCHCGSNLRECGFPQC